MGVSHSDFKTCGLISINTYMPDQFLACDSI